MKKYFILTLKLSILVVIVLPFVLGVKDLPWIAIAFGLLWFIYVMILLIITFLVKLGLKIRGSRQKEATVVRYELTKGEP